MSKSIISCNQLVKTYHDGNASVEVLRDISFSINKSERIAIVGPSGSGKSTLLHLLGGLDKATGGEILINGIDWQSLNEKKRCKLRNQHLGFIYQFHHLLPEFTALENVAMPLVIGRHSVKSAMKDAREVLEQVGLAARLHHKPAQLSGGERQRVAIARALVHKPACVFADEPTGNLDQETAQKVFELMLGLNKEIGTAFIIVTHDQVLARKMDQVWTLQAGKMVEG